MEVPMWVQRVLRVPGGGCCLVVCLIPVFLIVLLVMLVPAPPPYSFPCRPPPAYVFRCWRINSNCPGCTESMGRLLGRLNPKP